MGLTLEAAAGACGDVDGMLVSRPRVVYGMEANTSERGSACAFPVRRSPRAVSVRRDEFRGHAEACDEVSL